jgi:Bromodomain
VRYSVDSLLLLEEILLRATTDMSATQLPQILRSHYTQIVSDIRDSEDGWIFGIPVIESPMLSHEDKVAYQTAISHPMDLRTIKQNIPLYPTPSHFKADIDLMFTNCLSYNLPGQDAYIMGENSKKLFEKKWAAKGLEKIYQDMLGSGYRFSEEEFKKSKIKTPVYDVASKRVIVSGRSTGSKTSKPGDIFWWVKPGEESQEKVPPISSAQKEAGPIQVKKEKDPAKKQVKKPVSGPTSVSPVLEPAKSQSGIRIKMVSQQAKKPEPKPNLGIRLREFLVKFRQSLDTTAFEMPVFEYPGIKPEMIKAYYSQIRNPMDLETVEKNVDIYTSSEQFKNDMKLVVSNCLQFNLQNSPVYKLGVLFDQNFDSLYSKELSDAVTNEKQTKPSIRPSSLIPPRFPNDWRLLIEKVYWTSRDAQSPEKVKYSYLFTKPLWKYELPSKLKDEFYRQAKKSPADLSCIKSNLSLYPSPHEFKEDMELISANFQVIAIKDQQLADLAQGFKRAFDEAWRTYGAQALEVFNSQEDRLNYSRNKENFEKSIRIKPEVPQGSSHEEHKTESSTVRVGKKEVISVSLSQEWERAKEELKRKHQAARSTQPAPSFSKPVEAALTTGETKDAVIADKAPGYFQWPTQMELAILKMYGRKRPTADAVVMEGKRLCVGSDRIKFYLD